MLQAGRYPQKKKKTAQREEVREKADNPFPFHPSQVAKGIVVQAPDGRLLYTLGKTWKELRVQR